jgi:uncharacterized membrane protein YoaT (DUF817 family)
MKSTVEFAGDDRRSRFASVRAGLEAWDPPPGWRAHTYEFLLFGFKQGWACLFGGLFLALLIATHLLYPRNAALSRYDFLTLAALTIQLLMLWFRLETWEEARVILVFHIVGTAMELFKTNLGSWTYPEPCVLRIGAVPLFSGFMYACVGSYIARVWRIFEFRFDHFPKQYWLIALAACIYVNFFAHHWLPDVRLALLAAVAALFWRTGVHFRAFRVHRRMPLLLGFFLVALFIWGAENIGTYSSAWHYPNQRHGWALVSPQKLGAWYLLMIISFTLVSVLHTSSPDAKMPAALAGAAGVDTAKPASPVQSLARST